MRFLILGIGGLGDWGIGMEDTVNVGAVRLSFADYRLYNAYINGKYALDIRSKRTRYRRFLFRDFQNSFGNDQGERLFRQLFQE